MSAKARAAARKQRDKWKSKRWYTIRAPRDPWKFQNIGETIGESDEHMMGRVYEMTQQEFSGDFTKMHVILRFRVTDCVGKMPSRPSSVTTTKPTTCAGKSAATVARWTTWLMW